MSNQTPESIVFSPESLNSGPFAHVPDSDGLILPNGEDELVPRMEERDADVVEVTSAGIDLPGFGI